MKYLVFIVIVASAFTVKKNTGIEQFHWMAGSWKLDSEEKAYENWEIVNDTMMGGLSFHYEYEEEEDETELKYDEIIRLVRRGDKFYYIPMVTRQNNGKEIDFEIVSTSKNSFVAQNLKHDFPQRIGYKLKSPDRLDAHIEGMQNGRKKRIDFYFKKVVDKP